MPDKHANRPRRTSGRDHEEPIDARYLIDVFVPPQWLRDLGALSWLLVGVAIVICALAALFAVTSVIVVPVVVATLIAAVCSPIVAALERRKVPRAVGALVVFLAIIGLGAGIGYVVMAGVIDHGGELNSSLEAGVANLQHDLTTSGIDRKTAADAADGVSSSSSDAFHSLVKGLATGVAALGSLAVFLAFTILSLFFLLKDGPTIRHWIERHLGLAVPVAHVVTGRAISSLRGYFAGASIVAAFNGVVIGTGALVLGVPLPMSIALVNFGASYIPYLGAWTAGAFTVALAYGSGGVEIAATMALIVFLANGPLQQLVQPIAMGTALGIHPLAVLIVTIVGGSLFGTIGLVLAGPIVSAAVRISGDLTRARAAQAAEVASGGSPPLPAT